MTDPRAEDLLRFWLEDVGPAGWYAVDEALDRTCSERFGALWREGAAGRLRSWLATPCGALALAVLLDQMPRNIHRGRAAAFSSDGRARAAAALAITLGHDRRTAEPARQFLYLPFMHSESLADQDRCVRLVLTRMPETGAETLHHAIRHRDVIRRFGRFPSRNRALARRDTEAERAYRAAGGYMG